MKKVILAMLSVALTTIAFALENVTIRTTYVDGKVTYDTQKFKKQNGGFYRVHIPVDKIKRHMAHIDIIADDAVATKGEHGFWVMGNGASGEFNKDSGQYQPHMCSMPIFGMKNPRGVFVAIVKGLQLEQRPRVVSEKGTYKIYTRFFIKQSAFDPYEDIIVDFYSLPLTADYNEMAKVYRDYQLGRGEVKLLRERVKNNPKLAFSAESIFVRIKHCVKSANWKNPNHREQTPENKAPLNVMKTFDQSMELMKQMKSAGIDKAEICSVGWNIDGHDGPFPQYFPVEEKLGGEKKFREMLAFGNSLGYNMTCHINHHAYFTLSNRWDPAEAVKRADGKTIFKYGFQPSGNVYLPCMHRLYNLWVKDDFLKIKDLGITGIFHIDVHSCEIPFECCDPRHPLNKKQWVEYQNKIIDYAHKVFGGFTSECGMDHVAKGLDYALYMWWSYRKDWNTKDGLAQKYIPMWQLVYHGIIMSNPFLSTVDPLYKHPKPASEKDWFMNCYNFISDPEAQWLKVIELGGRPTYYFQNYDTIKPMIRAYNEYQPLKYLQYELMVYHTELAKNVTLTRYEKGDEVVVNYDKEKPFTYKGETIKPMGYKLFKKNK
ncbi:MAG: hypothetical protein E7035_05970 [Verrucomicrobiaceae bacterium]|nr:hypothetical protein [Verrucomicrobiaceae bacterium]